MGDLYFIFKIKGLKIVNQYCILVMWEEYHVPTPPMITQMSIVLGLQMVNRFCILRVQTNKETI